MPGDVRTATSRLSVPGSPACVAPRSWSRPATSMSSCWRLATVSGGRVFSHRFADGQTCERGAEFIDSNHAEVLALASHARAGR